MLRKLITCLNTGPYSNNQDEMLENTALMDETGFHIKPSQTDTLYFSISTSAHLHFSSFKALLMSSWYFHLNCVGCLSIRLAPPAVHFQYRLLSELI